MLKISRSTLLRAALVGGSAFLVTACGGGGGGGGGDDGPARSIDLSGANGGFPLDTTDDAAKIAVAASFFSGTATGVAPVGKQALAKSSTQSVDCTSNGQSSGKKVTILDDNNVATVDFQDCLQEDQEQGTETFRDGLLTINKFQIPLTFPLTITMGQLNNALLIENRDPEVNTRLLLEGNLVLTSGDPLSLTANFKARFEKLPDDTPSASFGLTNFVATRTDNETTYLTNVSGDIKLLGDCGTGTATVSTTAPLETDKVSKAFVSGELAITNANDQDATATFENDDTVTIVVEGMVKNYTRAALADLCALQ